MWTWLFLLQLIVPLFASTRIAYIDIVFCDNAKSSSVYSERVEGLFANIGSSAAAQGDVLQIHPLGLCNISNNEALYDEEWVGVVKLTVPSKENAACNDTVQKALGAIKKGAKAVIFDITDNPGAALQLNAVESMVEHPVITVNDESAMKLMRIVSRQKVLRAKISWQSKPDHNKSNSREYVDMVIFMTCFILITITCFVLLLKIKWRQSKKESSLARMAFDAVARMESKKYIESEETALCADNLKVKERQASLHSSSVIGFSCVICLEEFKNGQELRVVSCGHEFHLKCVDPWLLTNYTCPLCMLNIVEREGNGIKSEGRCSATFRSIFRCCVSSRTLTSSSMVYSVTSEEPPNDVLSVTSNDTAESLQFYPIFTNCKQLLRPSEHAGSLTTNIMQLQYNMSYPVLDGNITRQTQDNNSARSQLTQDSKQRMIQIPADHSNGKYSDMGDAV